MNVLLATVLAGLVLSVTAVLALRAVSHRRSTACPAWLVPLLENPYMNAVAGSEVILRRARVKPGMSVLDIGCGPGRITLPAARQVGSAGRVMALDLQPAMLARLEQRRLAEGIGNIETVLGEAGGGNIPEGPFDRVLLVTVLGEIVDQAGALREIHGVLKPGGILSITEVLPDPHYQSRRRIRRLADATDFEIDEVQGPLHAYTMNLRKRTGG